MAKDKYDFIQRILDNKKLNQQQQKRALLLAKSELKIDVQAFAKGRTPKTLSEDKTEEKLKEIEERLDRIEITFNKNEGTNIGRSDKNKNYINHKPEQTFEIFKSFKFNTAMYAFKYLVHGYTIDSIGEYKSKIIQARNDFKKLKDVPYELYKSLDALITAYEIYGEEIIKNGGKHPFNSKNEVVIKEVDKEKLRYIFGGLQGNVFKNDHFKTFNTAIQNLKRKYRFDDEKVESSILKDFLMNIIKYQSYEDKHSFKNNEKNDLFNKNQLEFHLDENHFFAWNPALKKFISWVTESILKHSNLKGERPFNPLEKRVLFLTQKVYDENKDSELVVLEITDQDSVIKKDKDLFIKYLLDSVRESNLTSVCDVEVYFTTIKGEHFHCSLLPKGNLDPRPEGKGGLVFQLKFLK